MTPEETLRRMRSCDLNAPTTPEEAYAADLRRIRETEETGAVKS